MNKKVLIIMALAEEGGHHFEDARIPVIYTGVGKINAAYKLTKAIVTHKPDLVINFGTAGSQRFQKGELVAPNIFLQRDMDVSPLGFTPGATPFDTIPSKLIHEPLFTNLESCICGTGDSFETNHTVDHYDVVDMEAYALAKICHLESIDFGCVKYISDGADSNASADWGESLEDIPAHFLAEYHRFME